MKLKYILILSISITALLFVGCKKDDVETKEDKPDTRYKFHHSNVCRRLFIDSIVVEPKQVESGPTFTTRRLPGTKDITICTAPMPRMVMRPRDMDIFRVNVQQIWLIGKWVGRTILPGTYLGRRLAQRHSFAHGSRSHCQRKYLLRLLGTGCTPGQCGRTRDFANVLQHSYR